MFLVGALSWWYGYGWKQRFFHAKQNIDALVDYFSIDLLIKTLFSPYRQISAGQVNGPIGVRWQAFLDRTISRVIGSIVRTMIIVVGSIAITVYVLFEICLVVTWIFVPLLPAVGIVMTLIGWVPKW